MIFYLDTSALLKRHIQEVGSGWLATLAAPTTGNTFTTALITKVEAAAGLAAKFRQGGLLLADYQQAEQDLLHDFAYIYSFVDIDDPLVDLAADLAKRKKLRGYDAFQLAAGLTLNAILLQTQRPALTFLSADVHLIQAVQNEGLTVDNPNLHP